MPKEENTTDLTDLNKFNGFYIAQL